MYITLSLATSADGYIDDMSPNRLVLSTPQDWQLVYAMRAAADAILIGANTLRLDDPSLTLKSQSFVDERVLGGMSAEPMRVVVCGRGDISSQAKLFRRGEGRVVVFSTIERELPEAVEVVVAPSLDPYFIVTELEKRGVDRLFVEGGASVLTQFLDSGMVDMLRVASNPTIVVDDLSAPSFDLDRWRALFGRESREELEDGMVVTTLDAAYNDDREQDRELMRRAVECSRQSPCRDSCYRIGAVVRTLSGDLFDGYTLETSPTHHAEQAAIHKAMAAGADLAGATMYSTMEPCSTRSSEPKSCSELISIYGFSRAVFSLYEPSHFVECHGAENMRRAGIRVDLMAEFADEVRQINSHILL